MQNIVNAYIYRMELDFRAPYDKTKISRLLYELRENKWLLESLKLCSILCKYREKSDILREHIDDVLKDININDNDISSNIKAKLAECENAENVIEKGITTTKIYDYIFDNKWFLAKHRKFRKTVCNKLLEFSPVAKEIFDSKKYFLQLFVLQKN